MKKCLCMLTVLLVLLVFPLGEATCQEKDTTRPCTGHRILGTAPLDLDAVDLLAHNGLSADAVVIITSEEEPKRVERAVYIRTGDSFGIADLVLHKSWVYCMTGEDWDHDQKVFRNRLRYQRFDEVFDFASYTYEITLHAVVAGELSSEVLDESQFPPLK